MNKTCTKCNKEKTENNFYNKKGRKSSSYCKDCFNQYCMKRWKKRKIEVVNDMGGCCSKCGYSKCIAALELHHIDDSTKQYEWSKMRQLSESKLKNELSKCILLCANCHRELHQIGNAYE